MTASHSNFVTFSFLELGASMAVLWLACLDLFRLELSVLGFIMKCLAAASCDPGMQEEEENFHSVTLIVTKWTW